MNIRYLVESRCGIESFNQCHMGCGVGALRWTRSSRVVSTLRVDLNSAPSWLLISVAIIFLSCVGDSTGSVSPVILCPYPCITRARIGKNMVTRRKSMFWSKQKSVAMR